MTLVRIVSTLASLPFAGISSQPLHRSDFTRRGSIMKHARKFLASFMLALVISANALAGDQNSPGAIEPPPPGTTVTQTAPTTVTTQASNAPETNYSETTWVVDLLQALITQF